MTSFLLFYCVLFAVFKLLSVLFEALSVCEYIVISILAGCVTLIGLKNFKSLPARMPL